MKISESLKNNTEKLMRGDTEAFTPLYEESYKYLHTCVIHIVKDEDTAQDMLQDTYTEVYRNIGQLKNSDDFLSWASTIANRKCFAYIKKNKDILVDGNVDDEGNESDYFENISDDENIIPENIIDNREKIDIIRGIIDGLSDIQRACVIGFYYNGQKQEAIADELGIPVNTVKSHINRAKSKIRDEVGSVEKKQGIKLCSIAVFMGMLFMSESDAYAAEAVIPAMSAEIIAGASAGGSATGGMTAAPAAKASAGPIAAKTIGTSGATAAVKTAGMAAGVKIAAGVAAGLLVIGGITGGVIYHNASVRQAQEAAAAEEAKALAEAEAAEAAAKEAAEEEARALAEAEAEATAAEAEIEEIVAEDSDISAEDSDGETDEDTADTETTDTGDEDSDGAETDEQDNDAENGSDVQLISGSFDIDSVIDKYANASKIAEIKDVVASDTRIYSGSGKEIGFFYNDGEGYELGYYPDYHNEMIVGDMDYISPFEEGYGAIISGTSKWLMNVYSSTDGECDIYVDFYAAD